VVYIFWVLRLGTEQAHHHSVEEEDDMSVVICVGNKQPHTHNSAQSIFQCNTDVQTYRQLQSYLK
jgi:hypothetical protein